MNKHLSLISTSIFLSIALVTAGCSNKIDKSEQSRAESNSQPSSMSVSPNPAPDSPQSNAASNSQPPSISGSPDPASESSEKMQFTCGSTYNDQLKQKVPTTIAWRSSDRRAIVQWTKPMDNYWSPEKRCEQVSTQINQAFEAGTLKFITNGKMNGQNVICTATEVNGDCQNLLMTLRSEDKPLEFLSELKDIFNGRNTGPRTHKSNDPQIYYKIDLQSMWQKAPSAK